MKRVTVVLPLTPVTATIGIRPVSPCGEQHVDDRLADRPRHAHRRLQVHAQPRGRVDLDDHAALLLQRPADVPGDDVDARDVEADHLAPLRRPGRPPRDGRGRSRRWPCRPCSGWRCGGSARPVLPAGSNRAVRPCSASTARATASSRDFAQHGGMVVAAARIGVDVLDQLGDGVLAVADDLGRLAPGSRHQSPTDDQQAVVVARSRLLDHDAAALSRAASYAATTCSRVVRLVATPRPWLPSLRLDDHRHADFLGGRPGVFGVGDRTALGTGTPIDAQQACGSVLCPGRCSSAMAPVGSVSAAWMRRCRAP